MDEVYKLLTKDEMTIIKEHYKAIQNNELTDKKWSKDRKRFVARLYERIRGRGYRLVGTYPSGSLRFASITKSAVEQIMDLSDDDYRLYQAGMIKFVGGRMERVGDTCQ